MFSTVLKNLLKNKIVAAIFFFFKCPNPNSPIRLLGLGQMSRRVGKINILTQFERLNMSKLNMSKYQMKLYFK